MREFAICLIPIPQQPSQQEAVRKKPDGLTHFDLVGSECPAAAHHEAQKAYQDEAGARRLRNDDEDAIAGEEVGVEDQTGIQGHRVKIEGRRTRDRTQAHPIQKVENITISWIVAVKQGTQGQVATDGWCGAADPYLIVLAGDERVGAFPAGNGAGADQAVQITVGGISFMTMTAELVVIPPSSKSSVPPLFTVRSPVTVN